VPDLADEIYDETTARFIRQWSALVPDDERSRMLEAVNEVSRLPAASRRVAAAMICAIELIARPELIP
jgi:hypothetical protein